MGNGMNKIIPGLYVGNFRDSREEEQLKTNKITHILSVHDNAKAYRSDMIYLCISARDVGTQDLASHFLQCNDFIHSARIYGGNVLIHCLAGMSRSVTVAVAYIMTVTDLGWRDALSVVRAGRAVASPNFGFQKQLLTFQHEGVSQERQRLFRRYPKNPRAESDLMEVRAQLELHKKWVKDGDKATVNAENDTYPLPHKAYDHVLQRLKQMNTGTDDKNIKSKATSSQGQHMLPPCGGEVTYSDTGCALDDRDKQLVDEMFEATSTAKPKDALTTGDGISSDTCNHSDHCADSSCRGENRNMDNDMSGDIATANQTPSCSQVTIDELFNGAGRKKDSML